MGWTTTAGSFYKGMLLLVAASPCALALGTQAAVLLPEDKLAEIKGLQGEFGAIA